MDRIVHEVCGHAIIFNVQGVDSAGVNLTLDMHQDFRQLFVLGIRNIPTGNSRVLRQHMDVSCREQGLRIEPHSTRNGKNERIKGILSLHRRWSSGMVSTHTGSSICTTPHASLWLREKMGQIEIHDVCGSPDSESKRWGFERGCSGAIGHSDGWAPWCVTPVMRRRKQCNGE